MPIMPDELLSFARELLIKGGFQANHAKDTAQILVWADMRGTYSHGVLRIPRYIEMVETGLINPDAVLEEVNAKGAVVTLDANKMPGATAMMAAMERAVRLADTSGIGLCSVKNITHAGAVGYFGMRAVEAKCIGIVLSASGPLMAYHGASVSGVSTNPLAIAVPNTPHPLLLDMSTSTVALGKIMQAKNSGMPVPQGWGLDKLGNTTTNADEIKTLTPLGGAKGSGLSFMIEILTSVLADNPVISSALAGEKAPMNGLALAIDISAFTENSVFAEHIRQLALSIKSLPPAASVNEILLPGERGFRQAQTSTINGIELAHGTKSRLVELAGRFNMASPRAFVTDNM